KDDRYVLVLERRLQLEPPVDLEDEVAERFLTPQGFVILLRLAAGVIINDAIHDLPVAVVPLGHLPAGQIVAIEERDKAFGHVLVPGRGIHDKRRHKESNGQGDPVNAVHGTISSSDSGAVLPVSFADGCEPTT